MARVRVRDPTQEIGDRQHAQRLLDAGRQHQLAEAKRADNGARLACAARPCACKRPRLAPETRLRDARTARRVHEGLADQAGGVRAAGWRAPPRRCMQHKAVPLTR